MKTLKKTLCLVLAMVMVFGLCAVSASAKLDSYKDKSSITYAEAVDVLSGIGILKGDESGFRPTANITRAEAAKIIAYIVIGNATQADSVKASVDPFTDVPAGHWAAGYIAYCATRGIVGGMGDGSYHPDEPVSGLAFAKMLLCALGYGKQDEYVGGDWSVKTASDAIRLGVFDDNLAGASEAYATREECALYAFNVIAKQRSTSPAQWGLKKVTYSQLAGDYVATNAFGGGSSVDANKAATFANDFNLSSEKADEDAFERYTGHKWVQKSGATTKVITADYPGSDKEVTLFTTKVTGADMYELFGSDAKGLTKNSTVHAYVDGKDMSAGLDPTKYVKGNKDDIVAVDTTGNGVETYVYSWYGNEPTPLLHVRICVVNTYLVKVEKVVAAKSNDDAKTTVKFGVAAPSALPDGISAGDTKVYTTENDLGFEKGDYVLVTYSKKTGDDGIKSMEAVDVVEDTVSRYTKDGDKISVTSGGATYVAAKRTVEIGDLHRADDPTYVNKGIVDGKDHKLYLDKYGYMISVENVAATSDYVYVSHFGPKTDVSGDFDKNSIGAKVYYADGTNATVTVKSVNAVEPTIDGSVVKVSGSAAVPGIYKLTTDGGKAVLQALDAAGDTDDAHEALKKNAGNGTNSQVKKGIASSVDASDAVTANNKTVFFYVKTPTAGTDVTASANEWDKSDFTVTVYTGINSVPTNKDNKALAKAILVDEATPAVAAAVLVKSTLDGDAKDTVYLFTGDYEVDENDWTVTYDVYVNGKEDKLVIAYGTEEKKNSGVQDIVSKENKFFTLDGSNAPVNADPDKEYDKYKYKDNITLSSIDEFEFKTTLGATKFSVDATTIINLTDKDLGSASEIAEYKTANSSETIHVALQYGDAGNYLYITSVT